MWGNSQQTLQATKAETNAVNEAERRGSKMTLWCSVGTDRITVTVFFKNTTTSEMCVEQITAVSTVLTGIHSTPTNTTWQL
jgi:hypothetical protein